MEEERILRLEREIARLQQLAGVQQLAGALQIGSPIQRVRDGVVYPGGIFVPLGYDDEHPILTSEDWNGDAKTTAAKALLDLSAVFGAPAGIKAVLFRAAIRDSGSASGAAYLVLGPTDVANQGMDFSCSGLANDSYARGPVPASCNVDGDVYIQIVATGAGTLDVWLEIHGYWL